MWEEYKETFDGVHASQRLKEEVLNMKREENVTTTRRIPAAALVAAILVIALAGTALAAGYLGRVTIVPMDQLEEGHSGYPDDYYAIYGNCDRIPVESLSDEVLAFAVENGTMDDGTIKPGMIMAGRDFASFAECESFLGLELADNPKLEEARPWYEDGKPVPSTVYVFSCQQIPDMLRVDSFYEIDGYRINAYALLHTEHYQGIYDYDMTADGGVLENYVTRSGMEVAIKTSESASGGGTCSAYFTRNNALFVLGLPDETANTGTAQDKDRLDTLKEILDAYE